MRAHIDTMAEAYEQYQRDFPQPELDESFTKGRFTGKVVVVTGGSRGIGRACVERFCSDGASVAIFARNKERGEECVSHLRTLGNNVRFYAVDVSNKDQCVQAAEQVAAEFGGKIDFLVNNHGILGNLKNPSPGSFAEVLSVNVIGAANTMQACHPYMQTDGQNCSVVNISSVWGHRPGPAPTTAYCTSKAALNMLTKCAALDMSKHGIRVNSISNSSTWTLMGKELFGTREVADKARGKCIMTHRRMLDAAGIASVVAFLCSKDAMFIDGADIPVDAGYLAMGPEGLGQE